MLHHNFVNLRMPSHHTLEHLMSPFHHCPRIKSLELLFTDRELIVPGIGFWDRLFLAIVVEAAGWDLI